MKLKILDKAKAKNNDLAWAKSQYLTPNSLVFETFLANLVDLPVKITNSSKSKKVDCSHKKLIIGINAKKELKYCLLESAIMTQLEKQQNHRFYNYSQRQILSKL